MIDEMLNLTRVEYNNLCFEKSWKRNHSKIEELPENAS